jgi:hypothetical protein
MSLGNQPFDLVAGHYLVSARASSRALRLCFREGPILVKAHHPANWQLASSLPPRVNFCKIDLLALSELQLLLLKPLLSFEEILFLYQFELHDLPLNFARQRHPR